jgi:hypothetical protein
MNSIVKNVTIAGLKGLAAFLAAFLESITEPVERAVEFSAGDTPTEFTCVVDPVDKLTVEMADGARGQPVGILRSTHAGGGEVSVVLPPKDMRRLAAAILNSADRADGTTPVRDIGTDMLP